MEGWRRVPRRHRVPSWGAAHHTREAVGRRLSGAQAQEGLRRGRRGGTQRAGPGALGFAKTEGGYRLAPGHRHSPTRGGERQAGVSGPNRSSGTVESEARGHGGPKRKGEEEEEEVRDSTEEKRGEGKGGRQRREEEGMGKSENGKQKEGRRELRAKAREYRSEEGAWDTEGTRGRRK